MTLAETLVDELSRSFQNHLRRTLDDRTLLVAAEFDQPVRAGTWTAVFEQGLGDVGLPRAVGGFDLSEPELAQLFVAGGRGSLPVGAREQAVVLGPLLAELGEEHEACKEFLAGVRTGEVIGGGSGTVDGAALRARGGSVTVERQSVWLGPDATVAALVGPDLAVVIDLRRPGMQLDAVESIDPGQGLHHLSATSDLVLKGDDAHRIWHRWQLALLADVQGCAEEVLDRSLRHASEREQFGRPIATFQAIAHRLADMHVGVTVGASALARSAALLEDGSEETDASLAALACWLPDRARNICEQAIQIHGGSGFTWELGLHLFYRRILAAQATLGGKRAAARRAASTVSVGL